MGFFVNTLKVLEVDRGNVMHGLKSSESDFSEFGELYFSWIMSKKIKAWKKHKRMTMNLFVPHGLVKFVLYDENYPNKFNEVIIGHSPGKEKSYKRLTVEPNIWFGFKGLSTNPSLVVNLANIEHSPNEVERLDIGSLKYNW